MNRRDLLTTLGLGTYALAVRADAADQLAPAQLSAIRKEFDRIAPVTARHDFASEPNMTSVDLETDLLVAGGGLAGVCAAVSAARHGAKVVLVQDRSRLGGNSSSEVKMHVVGSSSHKSRPGWRESGLLEEIRLDDATNNPQRCWELWDLLLYDKVVSEPNITLLLESVLFSARKEGDRLTEVMVRCDKSEHLYKIKAKLFVDATGDSRLGLESGAEFVTGRNARAEYGESLAPEHPDQETLGSSILFTSRQFHKPMPFTPPKWARKITKAQLNFRPVTHWEYGYWWIEWGGQISTIRDNERIRFELLSIVMGVWDYIKNSGEVPGSSNFAMDWVGMMPGKRGSRRLVGDYMLRQQDLMESKIEDGVAIGGWPMDDHPPGGFDRSDLPPNTVLRPPDVFNIPLRSLYSRSVSNLMMAGRNISATHAAFTSTRVMGTCAVIGQAVGTAAAEILRLGITPRDFASQRSQVERLQQTLLRDDQTIRGVVNRDATDLALRARVSASTEWQEAKATRVTDGHLRDYPVAKAAPQLHHWAARLGDAAEWLELAWEQPVDIRRIQLTFDSGFQRELTLTADDSISATIIRAPQPETVRDYTVVFRRHGSEEWTELAAVKGNHQRVNRHAVQAHSAAALRIRVSATNGDEFAKIFEVRCYA